MDKKVKTLITLGIFVVVVPFLGIPQDWKKWVLFLVGLGIVVITALLMRAAGGGDSQEDKSYSENSHQVSPENSDEDSHE